MSLSNNVGTMAGSIMQRDYFEKTKRAASLEKDPMEEYVKNFSDAADIINLHGAEGGDNKMLGFANAIKFNMQKAVAIDNTGTAIGDMMKNFKKQRELKKIGVTKSKINDEEEQKLDKKNTVFNKSMQEEAKTIHLIAQDLLRKVKY